MLWISPEKKQVKNFTPKTYTIRPGSVLDVPKIVLAGVHDFESALGDYFDKQVQDVDLLLGMAAIYKIYKEDGGVDIQSPTIRYLKHRHERVIVSLLKENVTHLENAIGYL